MNFISSKYKYLRRQIFGPDLGALNIHIFETIMAANKPSLVNLPMALENVLACCESFGLTDSDITGLGTNMLTSE